MQATIAKWGDGLALRLPRDIIDEAQLAEGATVDVEVREGRIWITRTRPRYELAELLAGEKPSAEFDWGGPVGKEQW